MLKQLKHVETTIFNHLLKQLNPIETLDSPWLFGDDPTIFNPPWAWTMGLMGLGHQALELRGPELRHAAVELRKDKEVVLQAVKQAMARMGIGRSWEKLGEVFCRCCSETSLAFSESFGFNMF